MQIISRGFNMAWDFRSVAWKETIQFNLLRSACAGLVVGLIGMFILLNQPQTQSNALLAFGYVIGLPLTLPIILPMCWLARKVAEWFPVTTPIAGLFLLIYGAVYSLGDPILCAIKAAKPTWVPMDRPPLFAMQVAILLLKANETQEYVQSSDSGRR